MTRGRRYIEQEAHRGAIDRSAQHAMIAIHPLVTRSFLVAVLASDFHFWRFCGNAGTSSRKFCGVKINDTGSAMLPKKKLNLKDTRHNMSVQLAMSTNLEQKKNEKIIPGQMWGQDRPEKNWARWLIRSGEIPSPRRTSIDKTNGCVMHSERRALVRDSDPPSGHSVHNTAGDTWRAPAGRLIQKYLFTGV